MAPLFEWLLRNSHDPSAKSTAAMTLNTTKACVRPMITRICERTQRVSPRCSHDVFRLLVKTSDTTTHHDCDADQNQRAAQIGVLIFSGFTVFIIHNLQDEFLLSQRFKKEINHMI